MKLFAPFQFSITLRPSCLKEAQGFANHPPSAIKPAVSAKPTAKLASIGCHVTSPHFSALDELRQDGLDAIGWDGEPDASGRRVELWIDGCQRRNADHVALQVHQRVTPIHPWT